MELVQFFVLLAMKAVEYFIGAVIFWTVAKWIGFNNE